MPSIFENPLAQYGLPAVNALIITAVAFAFLDGIVRWVALGIAALEILVVPQILKRAA